MSGLAVVYDMTSYEQPWRFGLRIVEAPTEQAFSAAVRRIKIIPVHRRRWDADIGLWLLSEDSDVEFACGMLSGMGFELVRLLNDVQPEQESEEEAADELDMDVWADVL